MIAITRTALLVTLLAFAAAVLPQAAAANSHQQSILQDDAVLLGLTDKNPDQAMAEAKYLGVDTVRVFVSWSRVSPANHSRTMPAGFDPADPNSPGYDWGVYDRFVQRARRNGLRVFFTLSPSIPYWASEQPGVCPHHIGGYVRLGVSCYWKPRVDLFGKFAEAVAKRYHNLVNVWSLYNEPNLEHYLFPQFQRTRFGTVDLGGKRMRALWLAGYRAIARFDPQRKTHVLFGETAAISSPMDTLYSALCLDENGRPYRGRMKKAQGCSKPSKLPIGGIAIHPYNNEAKGSVFTKSYTKDSLPMAYVSRVTKLLRRAARYKRIPPRKGIYVTEFGFQSNPPDRRRGLSLGRQAAAINEADRLFFGDPRVKAVAQFELYDVPEIPDEDPYNTGLRLIDGGLKPAYTAYRMPIYVTKLTATKVEVWGQVRPAAGRSRVTILAARKGGKARVVGTPRINTAGYFRVRIRRGSAAKLVYRTRWTSPTGEVSHSRRAKAGRRIKYLE
jgi:glycosyl hydrolase family 1